jgi:hypothetical protein
MVLNQEATDPLPSRLAWWAPEDRWRVSGTFEIEFAATRSEVWDAYVELGMTARAADGYECQIRHGGDSNKLGLVRAWKYPMPGGYVARSWEWFTAVRPGWSISFEGVASPPLVLVSGTKTFEPIGSDGNHTLLRNVEYFEFVNRFLKRFSKLVHRRINAQNEELVRKQLTLIIEDRRRRAGHEGVPGAAS